MLSVVHLDMLDGKRRISGKGDVIRISTVVGCVAVFVRGHCTCDATVRAEGEVWRLCVGEAAAQSVRLPSWNPAAGLFPVLV